ncbi:MAG: hypothetical protein H7Y01_02495, partial [Ferruginibacter sp.]|nr:hypothetical protein [Chitinophagaceae bacterium]
WLLVAGCWLLVAGCWLLVAGCWLLVAGCWLLNQIEGNKDIKKNEMDKVAI